MITKHVSAKASHYDCEATKYDTLNETYVEIHNEVIANILRINQTETVLDLTCGTGSQVIYLTQNGFKVTGSDINLKMLNVAKKKINSLKLNCALLLGDMRTSRMGEFDAVLTIFNAIGHLTRNDFIKALKNINTNLKTNGIYIFDIFNLDYMLENNNITNLTIDNIAPQPSGTVRKIQYSTINNEGILASYTTSIMQNESTKKTITSNDSQTLQIYKVKELEHMLQQCGFKLIRKYGIDGTAFNTKKTKHMLLVAQKIF